MAQHDYVIANGTGAAVRSDLNSALAAIVSNNSGATEPTPTYAYQWWADTTTGLLKIRNAANNAWVTVGTLASANLGLLSSGGTVTAALGSASTPGITFTGDTNTGIYSPGADQVAISTNGTGRLFVDSSGNVTINGQGDLRFADSDSSNWVAFQAPATVASNVTWTLPSADGSASQVLSTDGSGTLSWASPSSTQISQGNTSAAVIDTGSDGRFVVTTEGSERARIDSSGRLLVGTSSAPSNSPASTAKLVISSNTSATSEGGILTLAYGSTAATGFSPHKLGQILFTDSVGGEFGNIRCEFDGTAGNNDYPGRLVFSTTADGASSPTERMRIANDGKIGFGTTTLTGKFNFDGSLYLFTQPSGAGNSTLKWNSSTGAVTYDTSSRLVKENIEDCPYGLAELAQLKPRKYFRTDDQKTEIGFIADEVVDVLPEFVPIGPKSVITHDQNDTEQIPIGVNYEKLTAVLTKALQEAMERIETLEAKVAALEAA